MARLRNNRMHFVQTVKVSGMINLALPRVGLLIEFFLHFLPPITHTDTQIFLPWAFIPHFIPWTFPSNCYSSWYTQDQSLYACNSLGSWISHVRQVEIFYLLWQFYRHPHQTTTTITTTTYPSLYYLQIELKFFLSLFHCRNNASGIPRPIADDNTIEFVSPPIYWKH